MLLYEFALPCVLSAVNSCLREIGPFACCICKLTLIHQADEPDKSPFLFGQLP